MIDNRRTLDFTLQWEATDRPVQMAGTPDGKKGFGGFCMRFATPDGGVQRRRFAPSRGSRPKTV